MLRNRRFYSVPEHFITPKIEPRPINSHSSSLPPAPHPLLCEAWLCPPARPVARWAAPALPLTLCPPGAPMSTGVCLPHATSVPLLASAHGALRAVRTELFGAFFCSPRHLPRRGTAGSRVTLLHYWGAAKLSRMAHTIALSPATPRVPTPSCLPES